MRFTLLTAGLAATTALTGLAFFLTPDGGTRPAAAATSAEELFDPSYLRKARCSGPIAQNPGVQLASRSATEWLKGDDGRGPALRDDLGNVSIPITAADPTAQAYFDQGLRWTYGFNHHEAVRNFRKAQEIDPECAMCFWGEAFALGPNINAPMDAGAIAPALAAVEKAIALKARAAAHEQALIDAIALRYDATFGVTSESSQAFAEKMRRAAEAFPDNPNIQAIYVESLMDMQPWDYWERDGKTPKGNTAEAIAVLERTMKRHPDHPAAIHLYIHMTEASRDPHRAEQPADRLGGLMPGAGHLVHMPSHIYYRIGRYLDSLEANRAAALADETYLKHAKAEGIYAGGYYPHNIHFMVTSAQMAGMKQEAITAAERLLKVIDPEFAATVGWVQPIAAAPYFAHAQMGEPEEVLALPDPGKALPYVQAMWRYARGVALARQGNIDGARGEAAHVAAIREGTDWSGLAAWGVPAPDLLRIAELTVKARSAMADGNAEQAISLFEEAVAVEAGIPYMEPPFWYYPVQQSLGAAQLQAGDAAAAERSFRAALMRHPNSGWAYFGLAQAMRAQDDIAGAEVVEGLFAQAWGGESGWLTVDRL